MYMIKEKLPPRYAVSFRLTAEATKAIEKIKKSHKNIESKNEVVELSLLKVAKENIIIK